MRKVAAAWILVGVICWGASASAGGSKAAAQAARAEASVLTPPPVSALPASAVDAKSATPPNGDGFRDSAALVLVGSMLLGLAAAVRRTA